MAAKIHVVMNSNKSITGNFTPVATSLLTVNVNGIGQVDLNPTGGEYTADTGEHCCQN